MLANNVDPDQTPNNIRHKFNVASNLDLHCCLPPFFGFPSNNWLNKEKSIIGRLTESMMELRPR